MSPKPGETWVTTHGVRMKMPKNDAKYKWIRLDYRLSGDRRQRTFGNAGNWREAWLEANRIDTLIASDEGDTGAFTVAALSQAWQLASSPEWSPRYVHDLGVLLERSILPLIGGVKLAELNRAHARDTINAQPSVSGRKRVRACLSSMYGWGIDEQWIKSELRTILPPVGKDAAGNRIRYVRRETAPATKDVLALADALTGPRKYESKYARKAFIPPISWVLFVLVAGFCGLRLGELIALRGSDIKGDYLSVRRQIQWVGTTPLETQPKAHSARDVWIPVKVGTYELRKMLTARANEVGDGLMFPAPEGGIWRKANLYRNLMNPARSAAWSDKEWTLHDLRHHFCRWHLDAGVQISDVSRLAGHSGVDVTMRLYISANENVTGRVGAVHTDT